MKCQRKVAIPAFFAVFTLATRTGFYITTPLWLDSLSQVRVSVNSSSIPTNWSTTIPAGNHGNSGNIWMSLLPHSPIVGSYFRLDSQLTGGVGNQTYHTISPYFVLIAQWGSATLLFGLCVGVTMAFFPWLLTEQDRKYPKLQILVTGSAQGISSILVTFALSGSRTPPYLQAILANFGVPVQFIIRFLILRKRPTLFKLLCALAVLGAEFVCLIPTIFPQLESSAQRQKDGGATGAGRVLFPLSCVLSLVPFAIANSILEKGVQDNTDRISTQTSAAARSQASPSLSSRSQTKNNKVNLVYFLFWWCLFNTLTLVLFFWVDIIPGFGTSANISSFWEKLKFDGVCALGQAGCGARVVGLGWGNCAFIALGALAFTGFMRYSEGANFVVIALSLRTPLLFLFWTLFSERPFSWAPHVSLSTWLSFGGLAIMLPAIILYNIGAPEVVQTRKCSSHRKCLLSDVDGVEHSDSALDFPRQVEAARAN